AWRNPPLILNAAATRGILPPLVCPLEQRTAHAAARVERTSVVCNLLSQRRHSVRLTVRIVRPDICVERVRPILGNQHRFGAPRFPLGEKLSEGDAPIAIDAP